LAVIEMLLKSGIPLTIVGDPRQCTYSTNNSSKNSRYRDFQILEKVFEWEAAGLCRVETHAHSHRCNQQICDFVNELWPNLEPTRSLSNATTGHDGLFLVSPRAADAYVQAFDPTILKYDRRTDTHGYPALNFGSSKGLTFDRVLIFPHGPIRNYLKSADVDDVRGSLCKFYVAVTRARHSVAFVYDDECNVGCTPWT
jgi:DNA helicase II / ATP-dependent DNA helicase PcrA